MTDSSCVIKIENLEKEYRLGEINHGVLYKDLQSHLYRLLGKQDPNTIIGHDDTAGKTRYKALKNINLEIHKGDSIGIIGRNGAGKSTLLKILSRVTAPSRGTLAMRGRLASLLEVGTGFHPELSGRDNIYLNGAILGLSKQQISDLFEQIVSFSGVEQYVDTPVKRYSSGMYVRLAFSVAAFLQPDILIVDEVLAVGDAAFQKKCLDKMVDISRSGRTIIFVSHSMDSIMKLCNRVIVLDKGNLIFDGATPQGVNRYLEVNKDILAASPEYKDKLECTEVFPSGPCAEIEITAYSVCGEDGKPSDYILRTGNIYKVHIHAKLKKPDSEIRLGFGIYDKNGVLLFNTSSYDFHQIFMDKQVAGNLTFIVDFPVELLSEGEYYIELLWMIEKKGWYLYESNSTRMKFKVFYSGSDSEIPIDRLGGFHAPIKKRLLWQVVRQ